jgi:carbamoyl-phosphate synthase large subunit
VVDVSPRAPILVDKYILGREVEVDVIGDGEECLIPGIMEHIERAGVHSGDSMAVYPPQTLSQHAISQVVETSMLLAKRLEVRGLMNIQFVVDNETDTAQVLEVNPRSSRTVPYLSKITGIPMVKVATRTIFGHPIRDQGYEPGLYPEAPSIAVKAPVFSFLKLTQVDINLGPEMKSTGEIMGIARDYPQALYKALIASGIGVPRGGSLIVTVADADKAESVPIVREFEELGFRIFATEGTARFLNQHGIRANTVKKLHEGEGNIVDLIRSGQIALLINTLSSDRRIEREAARIRRASVEAGVPCLTSLDTARALLIALKARRSGTPEVATITEYLQPL